MTLRAYKESDCEKMAELFYHTVHKVNAKDYSQEQLNVWATGNLDLSEWNQTFTEHRTIIAELDGCIAGFGDMDDGGYLDRLYIHSEHQGEGIGTSIVYALERQAETLGITAYTTYASITAKPFFEKLGYCTIRENKVVRGGVELINYRMEKQIGGGRK